MTLLFVLEVGFRQFGCEKGASSPDNLSSTEAEEAHAQVDLVFSEITKEVGLDFQQDVRVQA